MMVESSNSSQSAPASPGLIEDIVRESKIFWKAMPDKGLFFILFGVWLGFFHVLGNSVFGYIKTPSLLAWMEHIYSTSEDDGHGFLVPVLVLGLVYWKRAELMAVPKKPSVLALGLLLVALAVHLLGYVAQMPQVSIVGFFLGIYALTGIVWGLAWLRATFFPMLLLAFCVPLSTIGEAITVPLRLIAAQCTAAIADVVLGIEVKRRGTMLFDPTGKFEYEVAAACGGIRSLITLLLLSTTYGFLRFNSWPRRALVILSAFPLAVAGNVFRLVCIIIAADAFGRDWGMWVHDNSILSLLPYIPAILGLGVMGWLLAEKVSRANTEAPA